MITPCMKILMSFVLLASLAACSKGTEFRAARTSQAAAVTGNNSPTCGVTTQATGRIFDSGVADGFTFEQRVKGLLAASIDPAEFGSISGDSNSTTTGVSFAGKISFEANGNVKVNSSILALTVTDSLVGQMNDKGHLVTAYPMNFSSASSGTINTTAKTFTVVFKDSYGEITLTGSYKNAMTTGSISFVNYSTVSTTTTGSFPTSGVLGSFQVPTCSFISE